MAAFNIPPNTSIKYRTIVLVSEEIDRVFILHRVERASCLLVHRLEAFADLVQQGKRENPMVSPPLLLLLFKRFFRTLEISGC